MKNKKKYTEKDMDAVFETGWKLGEKYVLSIIAKVIGVDEYIKKEGEK
jgi:hypothetical protein